MTYLKCGKEKLGLKSKLALITGIPTQNSPADPSKIKVVASAK